MDSNLPGVLVQRRTLDTDMHTGKSHVTMKADIGAVFLQAKYHQRLLENQQKLSDSHRTESSSQPSEGPLTQFWGGGSEDFLEEMTELNFKN